MLALDKQTIRKLSNIRVLDVDDLIIICLISDGLSSVDISRLLGVVPSALTHRTKKHAEIWPDIYKRVGCKLRINDIDYNVVPKIKAALEALQS
jgi:hypothetical protein